MAVRMGIHGFLTSGRRRAGSMPPRAPSHGAATCRPSTAGRRWFASKRAGRARQSRRRRTCLRRQAQQRGHSHAHSRQPHWPRPHSRHRHATIPIPSRLGRSCAWRSLVPLPGAALQLHNCARLVLALLELRPQRASRLDRLGRRAEDLDRLRDPGGSPRCCGETGTSGIGARTGNCRNSKLMAGTLQPTAASSIASTNRSSEKYAMLP